MADTNYRPAELIKGSQWYIEFQLRYPEDIRPKGKRFRRLKVIRDINRIRKKHGDAAAEAYAQNMIDALNLALKKGEINPFKQELKTEEADGTLNLNTAIEFFLTTKRREGIRPDSIRDYVSYFNIFREGMKDKLSLPINEMTETDIDKYLSDMQSDREWSSSTYNNHRGFLNGFFELLKSKKKIKENPAAALTNQKKRHKTHRYYDGPLKKKIKAWLKENDPYLLDFCQFVYYSCTRPKAETRLIKIGDIDFDRRLIRLDGKTGDRFVPICNELFEYVEPMKGLPEDHYVFSKEGPGPYRASNGWFSKRYKIMKDALKLSDDYTIYSWKHTRCVDLVMSGMSSIDTMQITGHTNFTSFEKYLRDLGAAMSGKVYGKTVRF